MQELNTEVIEKEINKTQTSEEKESVVKKVEGLKKKTDLTDIILEKEASTASRNKKLILSAAFLVLLFLAFLVISKFINSPATKDENNKEQTTTQKQSPINILKDEDIDKNIADEAIIDTDKKFEEMVKKLREEDEKEVSFQINTPPTPQEEPKKLQKEEIFTPIKAPTIEAKTPPKLEKLTQPTKVKKADVADISDTKKLFEQATITTKPKKEKKIIITEATKKPVHKKTTPKRAKRLPYVLAKPGYYIQVGATTSPKPNKDLIQKIKSLGLRYAIYPVVVKGRKFYKILVGPFPTKNAAGAQMDRVQTYINPNAFFYRVR